MNGRAGEETSIIKTKCDAEKEEEVASTRSLARVGVVRRECRDTPTSTAQI